MKSSLGKTLRKIRKGKQLSLSAVSDDHLSKSQISRFERGESEISCVRLINILDKLNISLDEFLILHNGDYSHAENFMALMNYIRIECYSKRADNIKQLLSMESPFQIGPFEKTMIKSIINSFDSKIKPTQEELLELTDYLFKIEQWGYYEIILLGNCVASIEYPTMFLLTKEMLGNYIYTSLNKTNKKIVTQLSVNCLIASIDNEKFENCIFLINEITKLLENELHYYEKTVFLYAQGYFEYKNGIPSGNLKMEDALQIFKLLGEEIMSIHYNEHHKNILN